ncbi:MAG: MurR/RpiR family transcriptional regulator [bacterium]|nr:MurR/RpiR family transcriptional regulator [bacterium]
MRSVLIRLNEYQDQMTSAESGAVQYILEHPDAVVDMSAQELAEKAFSSPATVVRLCRHLGFEGYKEMRRLLQCELLERRLSRQERLGELSREDSLEQMADKITYKNIMSLEATKNLLDFAVLQECVDVLYHARVIYLFGLGSSLCVARDAYLKFLRLDKPCILNDDWHSQLLQSRNMTAEDAGLFISYSGQTAELIECAKAVKKSGAKMILITRFAASTLSALADYNLYVAANESLFRNGAMSSRISQLNVVDILYTAFANVDYPHSMERLYMTHIEKPKYRNQGSTEVSKTQNKKSQEG